MSKQRSLKVIEPVFEEFNALKIRIAVDNRNVVPNVSAMVSALLTVGNTHYEELKALLTERNPE